MSEKRRYRITIDFLTMNDGSRYELDFIRLTTKPVTYERAEEIAIKEAKSTKWKSWKYDIREIK